MSYQIYLADCLEWADTQPENSVHAIVTDPPFGHREYTATEQRKLRAGRGGVWRIPPSFDGSNRRPLPRFTVLSDQDLQDMSDFFLEWGKKMLRILVPGGHVMIAANPLLSQFVWMALINTGFEEGRNRPACRDVQGGRPSQGRARGISRRMHDAASELGTLGFVQKASRGTGSRQSASVEDGRFAQAIERRALYRRGDEWPDAQRGTRDCASSQPETSVPHATIGLGFAALGRGNCA